MISGVRTESNLHHGTRHPMSAAAADAHDSNESFGRRLRRERERRQIALTSIAENHKISISLLRDLERDDVSRWPPAIYRRSYMRAYAQAVGLDVDATLREFLARFPDPDPDGLNPPQPPAPVPAAPPLPASSLRLTLADPAAPASAGRVLVLARVRLLAVACDAAAILTFGLAVGAMFGALWMPLSVVMIAYYAGAVLLLGTTPGVRLCASERQLDKASSGDGTRRQIWSSASRSLRSRFAAAGYRDATITEIDAESSAIQRVQA